MNRRHFISVFKGLAWGGFSMLIFGMLHRERQIGSGEIVVRIGANLPEGVTVSDMVVSVVRDGEVLFLSSACTHLGCRLQATADERLMCPCHGSVFDLDGNVLKGPAIQPLDRLSCQKDPASGDYLVRILTR